MISQNMRVVRVAAAVVADRRRMSSGTLLMSQQFFDVLRELGMLVERRVQVGHVRLVVLAVMDLHRLGVDVRLERVESVGSGGSE